METEKLFGMNPMRAFQDWFPEDTNYKSNLCSLNQEMQIVG